MITGFAEEITVGEVTEFRKMEGVVRKNTNRELKYNPGSVISTYGWLYVRLLHLSENPFLYCSSRELS